MRGKPSWGKYDNGIFYQSFTRESLNEELKDFFKEIRVESICIELPYISRIMWLRNLVYEFGERIPVVNWFGSLLIAIARKV